MDPQHRISNEHSEDLPSDLPQRLAMQLEHARLSRSAQRSFAPALAYGRHHGPAPSGARRASVAILLYQQHSRWHLPLTLRPRHMARHAGQLSLPGGAVDAGETDLECALRELEEELAVSRHAVHPLLPLSPLYVFASNFAVTPWLLWTGQRPEFHPQPEEVAEMIELPLAELMQRTSRGQHTIVRGGLRFQVPHIAYQGHQIWGATCIVLAELAALIEQALERL